MKTIEKAFTVILLAGAISSCATNYFTNPVIDAPLPDPTVIREGDTYVMAGTSGDAKPVYPIYTSKNLVDWTAAGSIFTDYPEWTRGAFWAPELFQHNGKTFCYYTAKRKSDGISCIGVAVAETPTGRYVDHGMLLDWGKEAIDAFVYDDGGQLWLVFKAYGLNAERPIELLAQRLTADGLQLEGKPVSILQDMQNIGMEGQAIFKHGSYYYLVYAARDCCSERSDYEVRVARAKAITGPYEMYADNPILMGDGAVMQSVGHGTMVGTPAGRIYYVCHAFLTGKYREGRKAVLHEIKIDRHGWPYFVGGKKAQPRQRMPKVK